MICDFNTDLQFSFGERQKMDCELIRQSIPKCVRVEKTDRETDKTGIDYVATLVGGAKINIDAKARRRGAVKEGDAVLALEIWSVVPSPGRHWKPEGKIGWTLSTETNVDMILYTFDRSEWDKFYLVPFQHLRMAFIRNHKEWFAEYGTSTQRNKGYQSAAVFVPAKVVIQAIAQEMTRAAV